MSECNNDNIYQITSELTACIVLYVCRTQIWTLCCQYMYVFCTWPTCCMLWLLVLLTLLEFYIYMYMSGAYRLMLCLSCHYHHHRHSMCHGPKSFHFPMQHGRHEILCGTHSHVYLHPLTWNISSVTKSSLISQIITKIFWAWHQYISTTWISRHILCQIDLQTNHLSRTTYTAHSPNLASRVPIHILRWAWPKHDPKPC